MRAYAIYEHPEFTLSEDSVVSLQRMATALGLVAASGAAVYEIVTHMGIRPSFPYFV